VVEEVEVEMIEREHVKIAKIMSITNTREYERVRYNKNRKRRVKLKFKPAIEKNV